MKTKIALLIPLLLALFGANLAYGAVHIPFEEIYRILFGEQSSHPAWTHIVLQNRVPQACTALLAGASLATCGLLLQTFFRNPLAGPSILGISNGANLGVAIILLHFGGTINIDPRPWVPSGYLAVVFAALVGAGLILSLIIFFASRIRQNTMLLIIGIMIGYLTSSLISMLNFYASSDKVHNFVMWGMGSFGSISREQLPLFVCLTLLGLGIAALLTKPLNALLLGENYASNLGVHIKHTRILILVSTGLLTATTTAFCGPISFIGLSVPHMARLLLSSSNHKSLLPTTVLLGAIVALLCNLLTVAPTTNSMLPLNAITPIIGAPVIIYVIMNRKNIQYFN